MAQQVVARYRDGRLVKGTTMDIDPAKPMFHLRPPGAAVVEVAMSDLKALFFVRSLDGNPDYKEDRTPNPADPRGRGTTIVRITFQDGELLVGMTIRYPPNRPYFYVMPVDPHSNNIRALVNRAAILSIEPVEAP